MNSFTDTEIDTLEIPKKEEEEKTAIKAAKENIVEPDDKNVVKLVGNKNIVSILTSQFFAEKECDAIVKETVKELWVDSSLKGVRKATQQSLPMNDKGWPYSKVLELAQQANDKNFKMQLAGFFQADNPQIVTYKNKDFYNYHLDIGNNAPFRKLTFIIQLSDTKDYDGGHIELMNMTTDNKLFRQKGQIIIFPSFVPWRVTKVTKGVRNCIEGWLHGPSYV